MSSVGYAKPQFVTWDRSLEAIRGYEPSQRADGPLRSGVGTSCKRNRLSSKRYRPFLQEHLGLLRRGTAVSRMRNRDFSREEPGPHARSSWISSKRNRHFLQGNPGALARRNATCCKKNRDLLQEVPLLLRRRPRPLTRGVLHSSKKDRNLLRRLSFNGAQRKTFSPSLRQKGPPLLSFNSGHSAPA